MKRIMRIVVFCLVIAVLSSCSAKEKYTKYVENRLLNESDIINNADYKEYNTNKENGMTKENGEYIPPEEEESHGSIRITFFSNNHLATNYYYDEEKTQLVDTAKCYLNPGESLYADIPQIVNSYSNQYVFSLFEVYQFNENREREQYTTFNPEDIDINKQYLYIPVDFDGTMLSIMPVGKYQSREIQFSSKVLSDKENIGIGTWIVNGEKGYEETYALKGSEDCTVFYDYSDYSDTYYFYKSQPEPFKEREGSVEFYSIGPKDDVTSLEVYLKEYKTISVKDREGILNKSHIIYFSIDNSALDLDIVKNGTIEKVKAGEIIKIKVDIGYKIVSSNLELTNYVETPNSTEYVFRVMDNGEKNIQIECVKIDSSGYEPRIITNGVIKLYHNDGTEINLKEEVKNDEDVIVRIEPNNDCYITGRKVKNNMYEDTMKYGKYNEDIDSIINNHIIKQYIQITLDSSDEYGNCEYYYDGKQIEGTIQVKDGDKIKCKYTLTSKEYSIKDKGWISSAINIFTHKESSEEELVIDSSYHGKTLTRPDFIEIEHR